MGTTLARCELYVTLGRVLRRFGSEVELYGGINEDDFYPSVKYVVYGLREGARKLALVGK